MMESIVVVAATSCDAAEKYYYILIVVAVISWMDENNFLNIIDNNLSALFTFVAMFCASNRSKILFAHVQEIWLDRKFLLTFRLSVTWSEVKWLKAPLCVWAIEVPLKHLKGNSKSHDILDSSKEMQLWNEGNKQTRKVRSLIFHENWSWDGKFTKDLLMTHSEILKNSSVNCCCKVCDVSIFLSRNFGSQLKFLSEDQSCVINYCWQFLEV